MNWFLRYQQVVYTCVTNKRYAEHTQRSTNFHCLLLLLLLYNCCCCCCECFKIALWITFIHLYTRAAPKCLYKLSCHSYTFTHKHTRPWKHTLLNSNSLEYNTTSGRCVKLNTHVSKEPESLSRAYYLQTAEFNNNGDEFSLPRSLARQWQIPKYYCQIASNAAAAADSAIVIADLLSYRMRRSLARIDLLWAGCSDLHVSDNNTTCYYGLK